VLQTSLHVGNTLHVPDAAVDVGDEAVDETREAAGGAGERALTWKLVSVQCCLPRA